MENNKPLAVRMRPRNFAEFMGQEHLASKGKPLRELIEKDKLASLILWGPPGTGKTSLAYLIASVTKSHFVYLSAVDSSLAKMKKILNEAKERLASLDQKTILTIDEIHRFNRLQQAALLPFTEEGTIILVGCTTENPYFEVIGPLISRSNVYKLEPLTPKEIIKILENTLLDKERGLATVVRHRTISDEILNLIAEQSNGDARRALNILESAVNIVTKKYIHSKVSQMKKPKKLTKEVIDNVVQHRTILYDKDRDAHFDTISAFIKSMRGSDPDAAVFYLVKMIEAGEEPKFIARRMFILASEDIGNADPNALNVAASCFEAVEKVGLPEAEFALAQTAIYLACAPKSNAVYKALTGAKKDLAQKGAGEVPLHLRNAPHPGMKGHGYGKDYQYPHLYGQGFAAGEEYLPKHIIGARYYQPTNRGYEKIIKARLEYWRKLPKSLPKKGLKCKIEEMRK